MWIFNGSQRLVKEVRRNKKKNKQDEEKFCWNDVVISVKRCLLTATGTAGWRNEEAKTWHEACVEKAREKDSQFNLFRKFLSFVIPLELLLGN